MKKVLVITNRSFQQIGGIEKHVYEVNKTLTESSNSFDITQICFTASNQPDVQINSRYTVHNISSFFLFKGLYPLLSPLTVWKLYTYIKVTKPELIHTHNRYMLSSIIAQILALLLKIPVIHTEHASSANAFSNKFLSLISLFLDKTIISFLLRKCRVVTAVSESSKEFMNQYFGLNNILVTRNFIKTDEIDQYIKDEVRDNPGPHNKISCIFIARLVDTKGYKQFLELIEVNSKKLQDYTFTMIGGGEGKSYAKEVASRVGNFTYLGELPRAETIKTLFHSDVYINLSTLEGLSTTIMEAIYLNKAIVATDIAPNCELLNSNQKAQLLSTEEITNENFIMSLEKARELLNNKPTKNSESSQLADTIRKYTEAYSIAI